MSKNNLTPFRRSFGNKEIIYLKKVISHYKKNNVDPGYQGIIEKKLSKKFSKYMHGGYSKPVSTGTSAVYVAIQSLNLKINSEVLVSPVNDSGPINCLIALNLKPILIDSKKMSYNTNLNQIKKKITRKTKAILLSHVAGNTVEIGKIYNYLKKKKIKIIEDCSQASGARCFQCQPRCNICKNKYAGEFGNVSAFSTMYRKNISSGGSGGIVFTKNKKIYRNILEYSDRGKKIYKNINLNDPSLASKPALNHNTNEFSCAITISSLERLKMNIKKRKIILRKLILELKKTKTCKPSEFNDGFSPFFFPIIVDHNQLKCSKITFAKKLKSEGVGLLEEYNCVIPKWKWAKKYFKGNFVALNAIRFSKISFNLFINENYTKKIIKKIVDKIILVEKKYVK